MWNISSDRKQLSQGFMRLLQPKDKIQCEYVWIDGSLRNLRTKSKTWDSEPNRPEELPVMEFCGSATDFDVGNLADFYAHPTKIYKDPFRCGQNQLIFCETYTREGLPTFANNRHRLRTLKNKALSPLSEFSFFQPFTLFRSDGKPLSYMDPAFSDDSNSGHVCGRIVAESHYKVSLYAGINIRSLEPMNNQGQWKYSVGPSSSVSLGDDVWMSRFLLMRVAEDFGVTVAFNSTSKYNNLKSLSADIHFQVDHLIQPYRHRIVDNLFLKFGAQENPPKIITRSDKIILKDICSEIDPYFILTRLLEAISSY